MKGKIKPVIIKLVIEIWLTGLWQSREKENSEGEREKIEEREKDLVSGHSLTTMKLSQNPVTKCEPPPSKKKKLTFKNVKVKTELKSTVRV